MLKAVLLCLAANAASLGAQPEETDLLLREGRFAEAEAAALETLRRDPENRRAPLHLAVVYATRAIEREPHKASAYAVRASAYERLGERALAAGDLRSAASRDPAYRSALRQLEDLPKEDRTNPPRAAPAHAPFLFLGALLAAAGILFGAAALFFRKKP